MTRVTLLLLGAAASALGAACAVAPIGNFQQDDTDTGAASKSSASTRKDAGATLDTPVAAATEACTNLGACANRLGEADATTFTKVAREGDGETCAKALAQCKSLVKTATPAVDAGTTPPMTPTTPTTPTGCTALTDCCDTLFDANNDDYKTCDTVVAKGVDASCNVSLGAFQTEGTCL